MNNDIIFSILLSAIGILFILIPRDVLERHRVWSRKNDPLGGLFMVNKPVSLKNAKFIHFFGFLILTIGVINLFSLIR